MTTPASLSLSTDNNFDLPAKLASIIEAHAGDYPLVSFLDEGTGPAIAWLYSHFVVEVFLAPGGPPALRGAEQGGAAIEVGSFKQAMEVLKQVEAILQRRQQPYIRLT